MTPLEQAWSLVVFGTIISALVSFIVLVLVLSPRTRLRCWAVVIPVLALLYFAIRWGLQ